MASLGVMVVGQPRYFWDAGDAWLAALDAERAHRLQPYREFIDAGVRFALSSDAPGRLPPAPRHDRLGGPADDGLGRGRRAGPGADASRRPSGRAPRTPPRRTSPTTASARSRSASSPTSSSSTATCSRRQPRRSPTWASTLTPGVRRGRLRLRAPARRRATASRRRGSPRGTPSGRPGRRPG